MNTYIHTHTYYIHTYSIHANTHLSMLPTNRLTNRYSGGPAVSKLTAKSKQAVKRVVKRLDTSTYRYSESNCCKRLERSV